MALTDKLTAIGNAIREKTGKSDLLTLDQMPTEIQSIKGSLPDNKKIIFMKYDGSVVAKYTVEEALNLEALPELPSAYPFSEDALIADKWIYTLDQIKQMLTDDYYIHNGILLCPRYRYVDTYTDAYFIKIDNPDQCTFHFKIFNNLNASPSSTGTIDFGDGNSVSSSTFGTNTYTHTYTPESYPAYYTIKFKTNEKKYGSSYYNSYPYFSDDIGKYPCHKAIIGNIGVNFFNQRILHEGYQFLINGDNKGLLSVNLYNTIYTLSGYDFGRIIVFDLSGGNINYNYRNKKFIKRSFNSTGTAEYSSAYNKLDKSTTGLKYYYMTEDKEFYFPETITSIYSISSLDGGTTYNKIIHFPSSLQTIDYLPIHYYTTLDFSKSKSLVKLTSVGSVTSESLAQRIPTIIVPDSLYSIWKDYTNWSVFSKYIKKASEVSL